MPCTVRSLMVDEAVVVGEQVALDILLPFLCNISFGLSCTTQRLAMSYPRLVTCITMLSNEGQLSERALPSMNL